MKGADSVSLSIAQNLLEIAGGLNMIDKVVRHYYLTGKKTNSYMTLVQLQMSLPQILERVSMHRPEEPKNHHRIRARNRAAARW